ncbi:MAG: hypothetical protein EXR20_07075 [Bacteroidetes bacterium]|jgi:hypothetical protein|nr:hypothetical protein [Bacteroidota bacterium]
MLYKVTDKDIASIKATSKGICLQKGIPEMSSNNGGMSYNPNFTMCVSRVYEEGINAANKGDLDIFNKRAKEYIQSKGGLLGFVEKLTTISSMIRSTNSSAYSKVDEVSEVGEVNDSKIVAIKDSDKNTKGSENNIKGVVLIILIVASLFIAIYYLNKREVNG